MPASLQIESYPHHLYVILESVLLTQQEVKIEAKSRTSAEATRRLFYGLRRALIASKEHPLKEIAAKLTTEIDGNVLKVQHIDTTIDPAVAAAAQIIEGNSQ